METRPSGPEPQNTYLKRTENVPKLPEQAVQKTRDYIQDALAPEALKLQQQFESLQQKLTDASLSLSDIYAHLAAFHTHLSWNAGHDASAETKTALKDLYIQTRTLILSEPCEKITGMATLSYDPKNAIASQLDNLKTQVDYFCANHKLPFSHLDLSTPLFF